MFLPTSGESQLTALVSSIQFAQRRKDNNALLKPSAVPRDSKGRPGLERVTWFLLLTLLPRASPP